MNMAKGVTALLLSTVLAMPVMAGPKWDRDEGHGGHGNDCYEHKGKGKCMGGNGHAKSGGDYRSAGGPPPWAPAHGWRRKNGGGSDEHYARDDRDYRVVEERNTQPVVHKEPATVDVGIDRGSCNRKKVIGTVLGGVVGGVIGNQVGKDGNREVATVLGVVIGGVVGNKIGSKMDKADHQCSGQVLEQARDQQPVRWTNEQNNTQYQMTPVRTYQVDGRYCRDYVTEYQGTKGTVREKSSACRNEDGTWQKRVAM